MTEETPAPAAPATPSAEDQAIAFARQVVQAVETIGPLVVPGFGPAIVLGAQIATGALDAIPTGQALWADIQAAANGSAPPSDAVMAASVAAAQAANDKLAADDKAALAAAGDSA